MIRIRRRVRPGHCYEVACGVALDLHEDGHEPVLAHAWVYHHIHGRWIGHAWVELDGSVYDLTIRREPYPRATYYGLYVTDASLVRRYTAEEAARALLHHGHYGPWPGDPGQAMTTKKDARRACQPRRAGGHMQDAQGVVDKRSELTGGAS